MYGQYPCFDQFGSTGNRKERVLPSITFLLPLPLTALGTGPSAIFLLSREFLKEGRERRKMGVNKDSREL